VFLALAFEEAEVFRMLVEILVRVDEVAEGVAPTKRPVELRIGAAVTLGEIIMVDAAAGAERDV
jgi:hypothetical protein